MKFTKIIAAALALLCGSAMLPKATVGAEEVLLDSGIDYTESTETLGNPGAGYSSGVAVNCKPNDTKVYNPTASLVVLFVDIGGFSSGANGTTDDSGNYTAGTDYDLDETFFTNFRKTLENCRKNGCTIGIRFRYDANGVRNPEPATFEQMCKHIEQIRKDGFLEDYKDIIAYVESGFVGCYGEQWGGKYCSLEDKAKLLDLLLDVVPDPIPVTVRTPNIFAKWAGIEESELGEYVLEPNSKASRVGLYNDGYMGSDSDLGTFHNRKRDLKWLRQQTYTSYYGGEFSGNLDFAKQYDTYLPENAVPEMYYSHLSYINSNIFKLYQDYTFGKEYDVENVDNSAYYGETVFKFIRDHIGYRFVLRDSDLSESVEQNGILKVCTKIENTGFANPIMQQKAEIILEKDGNYIRTAVDANANQWYSCTTVSPEFDLKLPAGIEAGKWNIYLKLSTGENDISETNVRSIQFANHDTWNSALGANYLGSFSATESDKPQTDNDFYQINTEQELPHSDGSVYTYQNLSVVDGISSNDTEYAEDKCTVTDDNGNQLYITNNDQYLYVFADLTYDAASPVYNLSFQNKTSGKRCWIYYQGNGFVYFNNGVPSGCVQKHGGRKVEFRIPLGELVDLKAGTEISNISVTIQDQANSWVNAGSVNADSYILQDNFDVYSAKQTVYLAEKDTMLLTPETSGTGLSYQWYHNGEAIDGATEKAYTVTANTQEDCGVYSVAVSSPSGTVKIVELCDVKGIISQTISGDVNQDGVVNTADIVVLQKYLLGIDILTEEQAELADTTADGTVNGLDLGLLRSMIG